MSEEFRRPFARTRLVLDMVLGIIFFAVFVAAVLPSIGLGFLLDPWWNNYVEPQLLRLILGAIGFVVCQLIIDRRTAMHSMLNRLQAIEKANERTAEISTALEARLASSIPSARVSDRRDESYAHLSYQLGRLPPNTQMMVTHFEKYRATPYDVGVRDAEHEFMTSWEKRIRDDAIDVKQIVHVASRFDLREVEDRLERYKDCHNFELSVMAGPFVLPYQDVVIAAGHWVEVALPDDPNNPHSEKLAVFLNSPAIANAFAAAFMASWGANECKVVRAGGTVNRDYIEKLESLLPDAPNERLIEDLKTLPCEVAALGTHAALLLGECISLIRDLARRAKVSEYSGHLLKRITELQASLVEERESPFVVEGTLASRSLIEVAKEAGKSIEAVSVDQTSSSFWDTGFGGEFLVANREAKERGVDVRRVFVIDDGGDKRSAPAIHEHEKFAQCRVVSRARASSASDFIIVDSEVLYEVVNENAGVIQKGRVCIGDEQLTRRKEEFQELWNIGQASKQYFRAKRKRRGVPKDDKQSVSSSDIDANATESANQSGMMAVQSKEGNGTEDERIINEN